MQTYHWSVHLGASRGCFVFVFWSVNQRFGNSTSSTVLNICIWNYYLTRYYDNTERSVMMFSSCFEILSEFITLWLYLAITEIPYQYSRIIDILLAALLAFLFTFSFPVPVFLLVCQKSLCESKCCCLLISLCASRLFLVCNFIGHPFRSLCSTLSATSLGVQNKDYCAVSQKELYKEIVWIIQN
jgi:hypothetical protein